MREILASAKTVREILGDQRYVIDYYQREYRWKKKQIQELIEDLTDQFLVDYSKNDARENVQNYSHYFLGSIILSRRDGDTYIVDGQQRLTTLTLLLILLHRVQGDRHDRVKLEDLIYSEKYGKRSFNVVEKKEEGRKPERAIFRGETPDVTDESESVQTIAARYQDLDDFFPEDEINDLALPFFCDWLIDNVHLVQITATTDEDAYTIFETMNDRGLSLTPLDMLKGFLLSKITDAGKRNDAAKVWRQRIEALRRLGKDEGPDAVRDEDSDAVKIWLRARHANSVRERHRGAENQDFERIGSEFHRWVGDNEGALGLRTSDDVFRFVHHEFAFYTRQYARLHEASKRPVPGMEAVYHVACFNFTLQYPLLLAPLRMDDDPVTIDRKIRAVATFLDILLARRAVNYLTMTFAAMSYAMFLVMRDIRDKPLAELITILRMKLDEQGCDFDGTKDGTRAGLDVFGLNHWSKRYIKVLLARMTAYVEQQSGMHSSIATYLGGGKGRFEIEHIWANHAERHANEFTSPAEFSEYRNRFGGLLLLPKSFNASCGDLSYEKKLPEYLKYPQTNLLAGSLNPQCYEHNPGFLRFVQESGLPFRPHVQFKKADLEERGLLYRQLAERIWNTADLLREAGA